MICASFAKAASFDYVQHSLRFPHCQSRLSWRQNCSLVQASFVSAVLFLPLSFLSALQSLFLLTRRSSPGVLLLSVHVSIYVSIYLSVNISLSLSVYFSCLSVFLFYQSFSLSPFYFLCPSSQTHIHKAQPLRFK